MPHFSADLLDELLDGDPAKLEALRAMLGAPPDRCAACRPAHLSLIRPEAGPPPMRDARSRRQALSEGRATKRRPGPAAGTVGRPGRRPSLPG